MEAQTSWLKAKTEYIDAQIGVRLAELSLQKVCGQVK
jgi:outer membrane protein TolC